MTNLYDTVNDLESHPFTLISLADREKFHTGLLAHTLRRLLDHDRQAAVTLLQSLWGTEADFSRLQSAKVIEVFVEKNSVDLCIKADAHVVLFAEMKLKTVLADHQLEKYKAKHPDASGVVLGLFAEDTGVASIPSHKFPEIISKTMTQDSFAQHLADAENDSETLIRMWTDYLALLTRLATDFEDLGLRKIPDADRFERALDRLKLKGVFEAYRFRRIASIFKTLNCPVAPSAFNTHGNAGLDFKIEASMPFGLQWQANALKLFVIDNEYRSSTQSLRRDERLKSLADQYCREFKIQIAPKLGKTGKFRSVVISRWNAFDDCEGRAENIADGLKFLLNKNP